MPFSMSFFWNGVNSRADTQLENTSIFPKKILNQIIQQWSYSSFYVILQRHSNEFANQFIYSFSIKLCSEIFVVVWRLHLCIVSAIACNSQHQQKAQRTAARTKHIAKNRNSLQRVTLRLRKSSTFLFDFFFDNFARLLSWVFFPRHFIVVILFHIDISRLIGMMWRLVCTRHFPTFVVQIEQIE